jgi:hypothetical protein
MATTHKEFQQTAKDFQQTASNLSDQARDAACDVTNKAKDMGAAAAQKAGEAASYLGKKADDATASVGTGMKNLAGTIRDKTPEKGLMNTAGSAVADTLESGGRYLEHQGLSGMSDDFAGMIRRNPIPSILLGIGVGYLIARATTTRS